MQPKICIGSPTPYCVNAVFPLVIITLVMKQAWLYIKYLVEFSSTSYLTHFESPYRVQPSVFPLAIIALVVKWSLLYTSPCHNFQLTLKAFHIHLDAKYGLLGQPAFLFRFKMQPVKQPHNKARLHFQIQYMFLFFFWS